MPSPDKERLEADIKLIDASMALATFGATRWDARRNYEWKMSFGIWALLAAAILRGFVELPLVAGLALLAMYVWWLQSMWVRHSADAELTWNFINEAQRIISTHGIKCIKEKPNLRVGRGRPVVGIARIFGFVTDWGLGIQLYITISLLVVLYIAGTDHISCYKLILKPGAH